MRRGQVDKGSQPIRNYAGNPAFGLVSASTTNVRQNLCWNPSMLGVTGALAQVRINRSTNPRGVLTMLHYSGAGAQTITNNIAVTAPEGITTAIRFTYGPSASNPGLNILSPLGANTTYTMSAYVMIESLTSEAGSGGFAENGVISGSNVNANIVGEWQKITWTRRTTASPGPNFGIRFSAVGGTGTGSILVTGIVIEVADAAGASPVFFDGATPAGAGFTYRWTGAANNSISEMNAPTVGSWAARWFGSGGGTGATYQSAGTGIGGSASLRKLWKTDNTGNSNDTGVSVSVPVTVGMSYTASIYQNPSFATNLAIFISWRDASDVQLSATSASLGVASPAGEWTRHSATGVAPTGAVNAVFVFGPYNTPGPVSSPATPSGATIDWDNCLIEQSNVLTNYFDGNMGVSGDYTYTWTGSANGGISNERVNLIPATIAGRSNGVGYVDSKFFVYASTAEDGSKTCKWFTPAGTPSSNWRIAGITGNSVYGFPGRELKAGGQYTLWFRYRAYGWGSTQTFQVQVADQTGQNIVAAYDTARLLNTTGWTEYRRTFTAARDGSTATTIYASLPLVPPTATDGVFEMREWMLTEGDYKGDYVDGTKPFSKWEGTVNGSTSVGYAPQLLDMAGAPLYDISVPNTNVVLPGGLEGEGKTFYTVFQLLQDMPTSPQSVMVTYGDSGFSDVIPNSFLTLRVQQGNGAMSTALNRRTGGAGPLSNSTLAVANNVLCWGNDHNGYSFIQANNGTYAWEGIALTIPHQRLLIWQNTVYHAHIRTLMYRGTHDAPTRAAISRYLGNKYGANVA